MPIKGKGKGRARGDEESEWIVSLQDDTGISTVKERWMNLAPLKDFCSVEEEDGEVVSHSSPLMLMIVAFGHGVRCFD